MALNYAIVVPAVLFCEELYGAGWRGSRRWLLRAVAAYAVVAIAVDIAVHDPGRMPDPALALFAAAAGIFIVGSLAGYQPPPFPEWRVLVGGLLVFVALVLHEHAVAARVVPWDLRIEPVGVLVFNGCLAYIGASRVFRNERQLVAIDKEMEAARRIQASILPRELPSVPGIDIAVRYVPLAAVAADFYDVVRIGTHALCVLVADVSGHGVPAALIASMVKVAFAGEAARTSDPAAILHGMNATLCGMFERAYVTAVCAVVDAADRLIAYASAGHPSPLVVSADGTTRTLDERGMMIGMFPAATYRTAAVALDGPTRLMLYTDGVTEAGDLSTDQLFGEERLIAAAGARRGWPADAFANALLAEVTTFGNNPAPRDDITILIVDVDAAHQGRPAS